MRHSCEFLNAVRTKLQPSDRAGAIRKSSIPFLKRLASTLKTAALQSGKGSVQKTARQEIIGSNHLRKT